MNSELIINIAKLHTTELGEFRIKRNLNLDVADVVSWCKAQIEANAENIIRQGKNFYIKTPTATITVNAYSYTIITAHKL